MICKFVMYITLFLVNKKIVVVENNVIKSR